MCNEIECLKNDQCLSQINADDLRDVLLKYLERRVGIRDRTWMITETVHRNDGPMTYYPSGYGRKIVSVVLTPDTQKDRQRKLFQMSHEVVHLLDPVGNLRANNLEEGFATWFSVHICEIHIPLYQARQHVLRDSCQYKRQFQLVEKAVDPFEMIKNIRIGRRTMGSNMSKNVLYECADKVYDNEEINFLLQQFNQDPVK